MGTVLVANKLSKRFGQHLAVDSVSFDVAAGEVMGLFGASGSGKSTILRMLTGTLRPTSGTAGIDGLDVVAHGLEVRRRVGYVPQHSALYAQMRVAEFLAFMGRLKGMRGKALSAGLARVVEQLALGEVRATPIAKLSRAYRQRVAIAQALVNTPPVLVFDEPTDGLDPRQTVEMRTLIGTLAGAHSVLVTSGALNDLERVAARVAILQRGRLLGVLSLDELDQAPRMRLKIRGGPPEGVQNFLRGVPGVLDVATQSESYRGWADYLVHADITPLAELIVNALVTAGYGVLEVKQERTDLESLFLNLTKDQPAGQSLLAAAS